jgi:hypothetical protein
VRWTTPAKKASYNRDAAHSRPASSSRQERSDHVDEERKVVPAPEGTGSQVALFGSYEYGAFCG